MAQDDSTSANEIEDMANEKKQSIASAGTNLMFCSICTFPAAIAVGIAPLVNGRLRRIDLAREENVRFLCNLCGAKYALLSRKAAAQLEADSRIITRPSFSTNPRKRRISLEEKPTSPR